MFTIIFIAFLQHKDFQLGSSQNIEYSDSQKHASSCLLSDCFSCISPEPLELQKSFLRLFAFFSEELSDERKNFQTRSQIQLIFAKTLFFQKK